MTIRPCHARRGALLALLGLLALSGHRPVTVAQEAPRPAKPDAVPSIDHVRPFLARHCVECHGAKRPKGDLDLAALPLDFSREAHRERWLAVLKRVQAGEMPPKG